MIAIAVSTYALTIAGRKTVTRAALVTSGIAMGIGICSMHYVGMAAIEMTPAITYDPSWVVASFVIAIAASFGALWIALRHTKRPGGGAIAERLARPAWASP